MLTLRRSCCEVLRGAARCCEATCGSCAMETAETPLVVSTESTVRVPKTANSTLFVIISFPMFRFERRGSGLYFLVYVVKDLGSA